MSRFSSASPQPGDVLVYDEYIHASARDGIGVSPKIRPGDRLSFRHNDVAELNRVLKSVWEVCDAASRQQQKAHSVA
jgi:8-amino-7-oxononanoate synthase